MPKTQGIKKKENWCPTSHSSRLKLVTTSQTVVRLSCVVVGRIIRVINFFVFCKLCLISVFFCCSSRLIALLGENINPCRKKTDQVYFGVVDHTFDLLFFCIF